MNRKTFFLTFVLLFTISLLTFAQSTYRQGDQITTEENLVSGKPYLLQYIGNNSCYVKANNDNTYFKALAGDLTITDEAIYYFKGSTGSWKIQSRNTGKYFPVPIKLRTDFTPVEAESAGTWALNFQTSGNVGNIAPSCYNGSTSTTYSLNRSQIVSWSTSVLHGWDQGTEQANQLRIYEIALSTTSVVNTDQEISVSGTGEASLMIGQWYVLRSKDQTSFFIDDAANSYTTATAPKGFGINNSKYLVHLIDSGNSKYYVQTGFGNYLFGSSANTTTRVSAKAYTAEELKTLWEFHKLVDPLRPTATEVYTLNGNGAWIFVPTGFDNQYYMYNISRQKFAYPAASGEWTDSLCAVPVLLESQGDGHYCITTKDGAPTFVIGSETHMTIAKSRDVTAEETSQLNTALGNLLCYGTTKLNAPTEITDDADALAADPTKGWYALRIHSDSNHPKYAGNFLYTLPSENWANGRPHPMSHGKDYMKHPQKGDATYYVRLWPVTRTENGVTKTYYHWQVPTGKYVVNHNNDYPITWIRPASDFIISQNTDDNTFYIQSSGYRAQICTDTENNDYLGKTHSKYITSPTRFDIYKIDWSTTGLTPWKVVFNTGADDVKLHCTRNDVHGPTDAYHGGYFFLPTDVTPNGATDFKIGDDVVTATIDATAKTISVVYAPAVCIPPENVTVIQGSRTTGLGNTKQAVLRVKVDPEAPCHPTSFSVSLTGAANVTKIEAWFTTADQLYAEGITSTLLGAINSPVEGANTITVDGGNTTLLMMGENNYIWITADISSDSDVESNEADASISSISYVNALNNPNTCTVSSGDPAGKMRIFMRQKYLWVSTDQNSDESRFYRNPAILSLGEGNVLGFSEYRYDDVSELGHNVDDSDYGHRIDIVMRKSTDYGATWGDPVTIATGTDATENTKASGYSKPAVVRTNTGKIICLMAMGSDAYESNVGLRHIGMMTSTDEGANWSAVTDIYSSIGWGEHSPSSAYITAGKGVTLPNGRVAFALNERNGSQTDEYVLYSDDEGATWTLATSKVFGNGKEAKLEVTDDNRLVATISRGQDEYLVNRGYVFTTGNASGTGVNTWDTSSNWGTLNSYGRNNDILYYGRGTSGFATTDVVLHTVYNTVTTGESDEQALRLYASFDQARTWNEFFTILPANAGVSAMQRLSDGNLAIAFEDGSIGGGANGSYALNYVVIHGDIFQMQVSDLMSSYPIKVGETNGSAPFVSWPTSGWTKSFTTTAASGFAGVVVSSSNNTAFNREGNGTQRVLALKPSAVGATDNITITAPAGFIIKSYSIKGYNKSTETYTLSADGVSDVVWSGGKSSPATFTKSDINAQSTTFSFKSNSETNSSYSNIIEFKVELAPGYYTVPLNQVNASTPGDTKSYATLYAPFDLEFSDNQQTKAYYITTVSNGRARLTETTNIPKLTAVLLVNSEGNNSVGFNVKTNLTSVVSADENLLKGTLVPLTIDLSKSSPNYSFGRYRESAEVPYVAGFYKFKDGNYNLQANRAWLEWAGGVSNSKGFSLSFDDDIPTIISDLFEEKAVTCPMSPVEWYSLDGRRLNGVPTAKGIYVNKGKKILIK
jgi:sialidase-1